MRDIRNELIELIKREIIGPNPIQGPGHLNYDGEEILYEQPSQRYSAGILFPKAILKNEKDESNHVVEKVIDEDNNLFQSDDDDLAEPSTIEENSFDDVMNSSNAYLQSAISLTCSVKIESEIRVNIHSAVYYKDKNDLGREIFIRRPINELVVLNYEQMPHGYLERKVMKVYDVDFRRLELIITNRFSSDINSQVYTFTLLNATSSEEVSKREANFFQAEFTIESSLPFVKLRINAMQSYDFEQKINDLLYREKPNYAIGHGCSVIWEETKGHVHQISSKILPTYEVKPIFPKIFPDLDLCMFKLSDLNKDDLKFSVLGLLIEKYSRWIDTIEAESKNIDEVHNEAILHNIGMCRLCCERMKVGLNILEKDNNVRNAFELMNKSMLLQQIHYSLPLNEWTEKGDGLELSREYIEPLLDDESTWPNEASKYGKWRPFQMAFILMNIQSLSDKDCVDHKAVDVIWFPTGGGKTEAYLGLSALTIFLRRITRNDDYGTTVIMRYTLRLLTSQQFERAASLICACEIIRRANPDMLGKQEISIGLWVGEKLTYNQTKDSVSEFSKMINGEKSENKFVIRKCPWCGAQMGIVKIQGDTIVKGYSKAKNPNRVIFICENEKCEFSDEKAKLPLYVVDEDIYESLPTLLFSTVDKFATIPFRPESRKLFGIDTNYSHPELIIQDELHLISGPLGSMVGLYELLIQELCSKKKPMKTYPKIVCSTATISRAQDQCNALYGCGRDNVFLFPPAGIDYRDNFFSYEDDHLPGRRYLGVLAPASSSSAMTAIRVFSVLLYGVKIIENIDNYERDPYWTNIAYFNSIKELGQTASWINSDIADHLKSIYSRNHGYDNNLSKRKIDHYIELTSRKSSDAILKGMEALGTRLLENGHNSFPVDLCLATNMISVGLDIQRLGLMTVTSQPKMTSEYIQATSRVGRSTNAPGLIVILYNASRPRDKSHYEKFQAFHSKLYYNVEPTSVTPFASQLRKKALPSIVVGLMRYLYSDNPNVDPMSTLTQVNKSIVLKTIADRVNKIDPDEYNNTLDDINSIFEEWKNWRPRVFSTFDNKSEAPLIYRSDLKPNNSWGEVGYPTPTSMRNVDENCQVTLRSYPKEEGK